MQVCTESPWNICTTRLQSRSKIALYKTSHGRIVMHMLLLDKTRLLQGIVTVELLAHLVLCRLGFAILCLNSAYFVYIMYFALG